MTLLEYLKSIQNNKQTIFDVCGMIAYDSNQVNERKVKGSTIRQVAYGHQKPSLYLCNIINQYTEGKVGLKDLRPDIYINR